MKQQDVFSSFAERIIFLRVFNPDRTRKFNHCLEIHALLKPGHCLGQELHEARQGSHPDGSPSIGEKADMKLIRAPDMQLVYSSFILNFAKYCIFKIFLFFSLNSISLATPFMCL